MAISLTPAAVSRMAELKRMRQAEQDWVRVGVKTGGCTGMTYFMDFAKEPHPKDKRFEFDQGVRVCVDPKSYLYMNGTVVDFVVGLMNSNFEFKNPLAKESCQCGESFSL